MSLFPDHAQALRTLHNNDEDTAETPEEIDNSYRPFTTGAAYYFQLSGKMVRQRYFFG
jgi:hypothetical protein